MSRYIDANLLLKAMDTWDKFGFSHSGAFVREPENDDYVPYVHYDDMVKCVEGMPTVDVVDKFIENITNEISERIIKFLEENYDIIPKKPVVRCKDCKRWNTAECHSTLVPNFRKCMVMNVFTEPDQFCKYGERRTDNMKNEEVDINKMRVNVEETWITRKDDGRCQDTLMQ